MRQSPTIRERSEDLERANLQTWATLSLETKGRDRYEEADPLRTAFQLDRDRIQGSGAFRRLARQSHAFLPDGEGNRSRLTHTLEAARLARTIARALRLNEDLAEAVAIGHALGCGPYAGATEEALEPLAPFRPAEQAVRVVERLAADGAGLNLTWEVRDGILSHAGGPPAATLEGQAARAADRVARVVCDLAAAVGAGILALPDLPAELRSVLGATQDHQTRTLVADLVSNSTDRPEVAFSATLTPVLARCEATIADALHGRPAAVAEHDRAVHCLRSLAIYHLEHPGALPRGARDQPLEARVIDAVTGLSDGGARNLFQRVFMPG